MVWWWIGNLMLIGVVVPVVLLLANRVLRPILEIRAYADDVVEHLGNVNRELDQISQLGRTRELTSSARRAGERYAAALAQLM